MKGRDKGGKENWLLIKAEDEYAQETDADGLLEGKPRSVKTGRTVEDVAASEVKIRRKAGVDPRTGSDPSPQRLDQNRRSAAEGSDPVREDPAPIRGAKPGALPSFVEPQLASLAGHPPPGEAWVHEIKFDGYRLLARVDRGRVTLKTRSGLDWTAKFPSLKKALEALPVVTAFLDGEVVVESERGTPDFAALQADLSEGRSDRFQYYLFDLMHLDGSDLTGATLLDRKAALARLLAGHDGGPLRYSEHFTERGEVVLRHACRLSLEGIVSKLKNAPYRSGRIEELAQVQVRRQRRVRHRRLCALHHAAPRRRLAGARLLRQGQARLCRPRRLGFLDLGGGGPVAPAGSHPPRRPRAGDAAAGRGASQRALDQAVAGGRGRAARLDGGRHRAPRRLQGAAPGQAGRRCRSRRSPPSRPPRRSRKSPKAATALPVALTHPDRVLWPDVGRDQAGPGRVLRRDLAVDCAARGRPAAVAGALSRRHRADLLLPEARLGRHRRARASAAAIRRAARSCWPSRTSRACCR